MSYFAPVLKALNASGARYLVAGGLAAILHGRIRVTGDIDLILDLKEENCRKALAALSGLGFRPRAPVKIEDFASPELRQSWIREKGMLVFSLYPIPNMPIEVDIFVENPIPFEDLWQERATKELEGAQIPVVSIRHLIALKESAGRQIDLEDIAALKLLLENDGK